jgi:hypothetical protein
MTPDQVGIVIADRFISGEWYPSRDNLATHISSAINQAMADERERCAKIAEDFCGPNVGHRDCDAIAAAIRKGEESK